MQDQQEGEADHQLQEDSIVFDILYVKTKQHSSKLLRCHYQPAGQRSNRVRIVLNRRKNQEKVKGQREK